uniref:Enoyl-CoA hydratase/isomerase domain-containing protein n=1 Tax=Vannella robusta TaxID=1487602 RepID=A0A7S4M398_9EUKA
MRRAAAPSGCKLSFVQQRFLFKGIKYQKTRLPPKIKRRQAPNEHANTAGVFHAGRRLPINLTKHYDRYIDVANDSAYHPPFLVHDYIMDTADYILEPFNAGKGVVMNRQHVLNALDFNGIDQFSGLAKKYMHEPAAGTVTFLKARGNVWSSGTNFVEILDNLDTAEGRDKIFSYYRKLYKTIHHLHNGPSIYCPFVDGLAMGSAASFVVNSRINATGPKADLCWPETSFGFHPDAGACHILNTLPCGIGEWMALTGSRLIGNSIVKAGLGSWSYTEDLIQAMQIYMDEYKHTGPKTGLRILENNGRFVEDPFELLPYLEVMERCFVKETMPEIMRALEKESSTSDWAKRQLEKLKKKSPLSLVITLEALRRSRGKSINYVLRQDFRLTTRFLDSKDFREGVQKMVVERAMSEPEWEYKSVSDVPQSVVESFFAPTGNEDTEFIIDGNDDKEQLERQYEEMTKDYDWMKYGKSPDARNLKLTPPRTERDLNVASVLSNQHAPVPVQDVLDDKGLSKMNEIWHPEDYFERSVFKDHFVGPSILKKYDFSEAAFRLRILDSMNAAEVFKEERPVSEHGKWRGRYDIFDSYNGLRHEFNVVQHPFPKYDSVIRNRTVSVEEKEVEEEDYESEVEVFKNIKEDYGTYPRKSMRFPPGKKIPETLAEATQVNFSDDDYSTVEEDPYEGDGHMALPKDRVVQDPQAARWDSDF